jgi:hypothetical protein
MGKMERVGLRGKGDSDLRNNLCELIGTPRCKDVANHFFGNIFGNI